MKNFDSKAGNYCNFFINLFDNGEFNEIVITQGQDGYSVNMDNDTYLGTLIRNSDSTWNLIKGRLPNYVLSQITRGIDRKMKN